MRNVLTCRTWCSTRRMRWKEIGMLETGRVSYIRTECLWIEREKRKKLEMWKSTVHYLRKRRTDSKFLNYNRKEKRRKNDQRKTENWTDQRERSGEREKEKNWTICSIEYSMEQNWAEKEEVRVPIVTSDEANSHVVMVKSWSTELRVLG